MNSKKEIILVYPDFRSSKVFSNPGLPVGLGYIARAIEIAGINYEVIDLNIDSKDYLIRTIHEFSPQLMGISMLSYRCKETYVLLENLKYEFPQLQIIAGGPHITANREVVLMECTAIDLGVVMEGDSAIVEIIRGDSIPTIKGLLYRAEEAIKFTGERDFIFDLDQIPFPTYKGFKLEKYGRTMSIHSSRGCPYRCIFCGAPRILGRKWRKRSAQSMKEEIIYWYKRRYRMFSFSDSNFLIDKKRIWEFCESIIKSAMQINFVVEGLRANHVNRKLLQQMRRAGFTALTFGVESGSNMVLKNLKKEETREEIESAIATAVDLGFHVILFFLIGSPGEEAADILQSFQLSRKYKVAEVYFFNLTPIPGTEFYDWAIARGYLDERGTKYPEGNFGFQKCALLPTDTMTVEQLNYYIRLARRIELQVRYKFFIDKLLNRDKTKILFVNDRILNSLSWFISNPAIAPIFKILLFLVSVTLSLYRKTKWNY